MDRCVIGPRLFEPPPHVFVMLLKEPIEQLAKIIDGIRDGADFVGSALEVDLAGDVHPASRKSSAALLSAPTTSPVTSFKSPSRYRSSIAVFDLSEMSLTATRT